jgi:hypothetical protein
LSPLLLLLLLLPAPVYMKSSSASSTDWYLLRISALDVMYSDCNIEHSSHHKLILSSSPAHTGALSSHHKPSRKV